MVSQFIQKRLADKYIYCAQYLFVFRQRSRQPMQAPNYEPLRDLGSGVFGSVFLVQHRVTKKRYAIKRVERASQQLSRQYQILKIIQGCDNVVKMEDYFFTKVKNNKTLHNIVFEYVEDNLEKIIQNSIKNCGKIKQADVKDYMYQLLNGLAGIHSKKVAHRDLKPENILVSSAGRIKICDFGSSKIINQKGLNTPYIVSRYYRAPELIFCITKYSTQIDIWAAGCILAELFLLKPLFKGTSEGDQLFKVIQLLGSFNQQEINEYKSKIPFDPTLFASFEGYPRKNLDQIFHMVGDRKKFLDLLLKMLCYSPSKRITAAEALKHPYFDSINKRQKSLKKYTQTQSETHSGSDSKNKEKD